MFQIKVCGLTTLADAQAVVREGADAIGLNFYPKSSRFVDEVVAKAIVTDLPRRIARVGVFVNAEASEVNRLATELGLDYVQLHGDESPDYLGQITSAPVIRAFRVGPAGLAPIVGFLERCETRNGSPAALLLDAFHPELYGGSGQTLDWSRLQGELDLLPPLPWILAGGLTAANVAEAIRGLGPSAVDTASGVESSPGRKDPVQVRSFVQAVRSVWG